MKNQKVDTRVRNWSFIVYTESAPVNWKELISELIIPWACSPLHDKDTDTGGHIIKPHYHCLLTYTNKKSYQQVLAITKKINAVNPKRCESIPGLVRYFAHVDTPNKQQYDVNEIEGYFGFDTDKYLKGTTKGNNEALIEIRAYITENDITEIKSLYAYTDANRPDWSRIINNNMYGINSFIASMRYSKQKSR